MNKCLCYIFLLSLSSCFKENRKLPYELNKSISKFKATSKDSLTEVTLIPASKFYWALKNGDVIRDSFEIENSGKRNDFKIDYLNNGINRVRLTKGKKLYDRKFYL